MARKKWCPIPPRPAFRPKLTPEDRAAVDALAAPVVARLNRRCKPPKGTPLFNYAESVLIRWHREALFLVLIMRTPHGRPATFESRAARMEHTGAEKFNLAIPMRRGWNTVLRDATPEECLAEISRSVR